jgi:site-specific recombinase XerC
MPVGRGLAEELVSLDAEHLVGDAEAEVLDEAAFPGALAVKYEAPGHVARHGTTPDGYLFQGRKHKLVIRRTYQEDFGRSAEKAGLPPEFIPHSLRHCHASIAP